MSDPLLKRALRGHKDAVTSVSFNPNMKQIASGSHDSVVTVWNFKAHQRPFKFVGHKGPVHGVAFSPNGQLVASASKDETVRLWQNSIEGYSTTIKAHSGAVRSVEFSSDGNLLVTSSDDKTVKVWNVSDRKFLYTLSGHNNWIRSAQFSPDVRLIASGSDDKTVKVWDVDRRQDIHTFYDHTGIVNTVRFNPDGTMLASGSHDKKIKLWDVRSKRLVQHYDAHADSVNQVAFHTSGHYLVSASSDSKLKVWDVRQGKLAYTLYGHEGESTAVNFSAGGNYFGSGGSDNVVMVWQSNFPNTSLEKLEDLPEVEALQNPKLSKSGKKTFGTKTRAVSAGLKNTVTSPTLENNRSQVQTRTGKENIGSPLIQGGTLSDSNKYNQPHEEVKENFGLTNASQQAPGISPAMQKYMNKLPELLSGPLDRIVNQLDTISKSIQSLETRLAASEDTVAHLLQIATSSKSPNKNDFMGSSFKVGSENPNYSSLSIPQHSMIKSTVQK